MSSTSTTPKTMLIYVKSNDKNFVKLVTTIKILSSLGIGFLDICLDLHNDDGSNDLPAEEVAIRLLLMTSFEGLRTLGELEKLHVGKALRETGLKGWEVMKQEATIGLNYARGLLSKCGPESVFFNDLDAEQLAQARTIWLKPNQPDGVDDQPAMNLSRALKVLMLMGSVAFYCQFKSLPQIEPVVRNFVEKVRRVQEKFNWENLSLRFNTSDKYQYARRMISFAIQYSKLARAAEESSGKEAEEELCNVSDSFFIDHTDKRRPIKYDYSVNMFVVDLEPELDDKIPEAEAKHAWYPRHSYLLCDKESLAITYDDSLRCYVQYNTADHSDVRQIVYNYMAISACEIGCDAATNANKTLRPAVKALKACIGDFADPRHLDYVKRGIQVTKEIEGCYWQIAEHLDAKLSPTYLNEKQIAEMEKFAGVLNASLP